VIGKLSAVLLNSDINAAMARDRCQSSIDFINMSIGLNFDYDDLSISYDDLSISYDNLRISFGNLRISYDILII
jgi:hypothetical protein